MIRQAMSLDCVPHRGHLSLRARLKASLRGTRSADRPGRL